MRHHHNGNAIVEFALVFPLFTLLILMSLDVSRIFLERIVLERIGFRLSRILLLQDTSSIQELKSYSENWIQDHVRASIEPEIKIRAIESDALFRVGEKSRNIEIIELNLRKKMKPLFIQLQDAWIKTHIRKVRIR